MRNRFSVVECRVTENGIYFSAFLESGIRTYTEALERAQHYNVKRNEIVKRAFGIRARTEFGLIKAFELFRGYVCDVIEPENQSSYVQLVVYRDPEAPFDFDMLSANQVISANPRFDIEHLSETTHKLDEFHILWNTGEMVDSSQTELSRGVNVQGYDMEDALANFEKMQPELSKKLPTNKHFKIKYILNLSA